MSFLVGQATGLYVKRKTRKLWKQGGWGPLQTWTLAGPGDTPLYFQLRLPLTLELDERGPREPVPELSWAQRRAASAGQVIVEAAIYPLAGLDDGRLAAILTATFAPRRPPIEAGEETDGELRIGTRVDRLSERVEEVTRYIVRTRRENGEQTPMMLLQYVIQSRYGWLTVAFGISDPAWLSAPAREALFKIVETGFIGERPQES